MQVQVKCGGFDLGTMDEADVRDTCRRGEGRIVRATHGTWFPSFLVLNKTATERTRALCNSSSQSALSPTQREEVYWGFRKDHTDGPVRHLTVVRKARKLKDSDKYSLENWGETERFPRNRWNPDRIPVPLFASERQYREAQA